MSVEFCEAHSRHYDTDLELACPRCEGEPQSFSQMIIAVRGAMGVSQADFAAGVGVSPQYLCDVENERRSPSVNLTDQICKFLGRGPNGCKDWHQAGARAAGWKI